MKVKEGVLLSGLKLEMRTALMAVESAYKKYGYEPEITSTNEDCFDKDGNYIHSTGSIHPYGYAFDVGIKGLTAEHLAKIMKQLKSALKPAGFDVVLEADHIHIEYDRILR